MKIAFIYNAVYPRIRESMISRRLAKKHEVNWHGLG